VNLNDSTEVESERVAIFDGRPDRKGVEDTDEETPERKRKIQN
jgi:hypothetical protein